MAMAAVWKSKADIAKKPRVGIRAQMASSAQGYGSPSEELGLQQTVSGAMVAKSLHNRVRTVQELDH